MLDGARACRGRDKLGGCWKADQAVAHVRSTLDWLGLVLEEVEKCSWLGSMVHVLGPGLVLKVGYAGQVTCSACFCKVLPPFSTMQPSVAMSSRS